MTKISKIIEETIADTVVSKDERDAIFQAVQLQEKFGSSKSVDLLDKYEKIIEGLIK